MKQDFESFFQANEKRIYFQMRRIGIPDQLHGEFYAEGIVAMWQAYKQYQPSKGNIGTFLNYQIRYRLIDLIRKNVRDKEVVEQAAYEQSVLMGDGNRYGTTGLPVIPISQMNLDNESFWQWIQAELTDKQWKWVHYYIIANLTLKEIAEIEAVSIDAVKSWGREARRKLRDEIILKKLKALLSDTGQSDD